MKIRLTQDCEHGEKGKVLEIDPEKAEAFAAEGKSEPYVDEPEPAEDVAPDEPDPPLAPELESEPAAPAAPKAKVPAKAAPKKGKR